MRLRTILIAGIIGVAFFFAMAGVEISGLGGATKVPHEIIVTPSPANLGVIAIEKTPMLFRNVITITNGTEEPVGVEHLKSSCGCTVADISDKVLNPGQSTHLDLEIGSSSLGPGQSTLFIGFDNPKTPAIEIPVRFELVESVRVRPNYLDLIFSDEQHSIDTNFHLAANENTNFDDMKVSLSSVKGVVAEILDKKISNDADGHSNIDLQVRWKIEDFARTKAAEIQFVWSEGRKSISAKAGCRTDYRIEPEQIVLTSVKVLQTVQRDLQISRADRQPFRVKDFTADIPGLEIIPLDEGKASVHNFQVRFHPKQEGIARGQIVFNAQPSQVWPIKLAFFALVRK